jgi:AGCS family alanine or glycine:cation symporter
LLLKQKKGRGNMRTLINKFLLIVLMASSLSLGSFALAQDEAVAEPVTKAWDQTLSDSINSAMAPITNAVAGTVFYTFTFGDTGDNDVCDAVGEDCFGLRWIVVWLAFGALFFTFYLGFINFRGFKHAWTLVFSKDADPDNPGDVTHFQALTTALSGTVGLGNIAGVAVAISVGGPGATFWMNMAGIFGMSSKFVECTLGVKYREFLPDGHVAGGPMR